MDMIPFSQAVDIVMESDIIMMESEKVSLKDSLGRVLAVDVISDMDMPPFDKSSVDGFACRKEDLGNELEVLETVPAGVWPSKNIKEGCCSRVMTGAPVPAGADCMIMVEDTETLPSGRIRFTGTLKKDNIALKGEDIRKGDIVIRAGSLIRPQHIATMASVGHVSPQVSLMPTVAVISSGSELVEPGSIPGLSQIRNSNSSQLLAQIEQAGAAGKYYGIAIDDEKITFGIVQKAIAENDLVIITGGVSVGDFDFVPSVLEKAGVKILFSRVAVQPGKPATFGLHPEAAVFGLPGNPVSSFLQFELLVKPLLYRMMNCNWKPLTLKLPMAMRYVRRSSDRMALIPVKLTSEGTVFPVEYHGSAHITAMNETDGIISMPVEIKIFEKGEIVSVRQI
ncbi:MAG: molybdopterin molybdotransferase MoeA [Bacteroidales bacterium]|nr:molybdopterin molybdotransferase MoeA [Bacteroidales bacterium]